MGGKGKIIIMNGKEGVQVRDDRRKGEKKVIEEKKGIEIIKEKNKEYNVDKDKEEMKRMMLEKKEIEGVMQIRGEIEDGEVIEFERKGRDKVKIKGENESKFMEIWKEKGMKEWEKMKKKWIGEL